MSAHSGAASQAEDPVDGKHPGGAPFCPNLQQRSKTNLDIKMLKKKKKHTFLMTLFYLFSSLFSSDSSTLHLSLS